MALAKAYEEAKVNQRLRNGDVSNGVEGTTLGTEFFDGSEGRPHAALLKFSPGRSSQPHFHAVDQFQIAVGGKAKMGRHDMPAYSVHFSRAYTPYGPFVSDKDDGLLCFNLHSLVDRQWRAQHLPQQADKLKEVQNRQPWQITAPAPFPDSSSGDVDMRDIPGLQDEHGLAGCTLNLKSNASCQSPDCSKGDGQYVVVVDGSIIHEQKELVAPALVYVYPQEKTYTIKAGAKGARALVVNFPVNTNKLAKATPQIAAEAGAPKVMGCDLCSFVYDEEAGLASEGIAPGTRWADVPEDWTCPDCGAGKRDFHLLEL